MNQRKEQFPYEEFKSIYSRVPRLTVDLVIKTKQGILLTLRNSDGWIGQWHLPGGGVHFREKVIDCVQRIAKEELNIPVIVEKNLGYIEYFSEEKERGYGYSISLVFLCTPLDDKIVLDSRVEKYGFFGSLPENTIVEVSRFLTENKIIPNH